MDNIISCEFNIDTGYVELLFADGSTISIDCTAVEDEITYSRFDRSELDWLIYNKPLEYANLVLNGGIEEYCKNSREHTSLRTEKSTGGHTRPHGLGMTSFLSPFFLALSVGLTRS